MISNDLLLMRLKNTAFPTDLMEIKIMSLMIKKITALLKTKIQTMMKIKIG